MGATAVGKHHKILGAATIGVVGFDSQSWQNRCCCLLSEDPCYLEFSVHNSYHLLYTCIHT